MINCAPIILASASPRRLALCQQIGVDIIEQIPAHIDEKRISTKELAKNYVSRLALEKAMTVSASYQDNLVLAADTIVVKGRRILEKADNRDKAKTMLSLLSGGRHRVLTAVCLVKNQQKIGTKLVTSIVKFRYLTETDINDYLDYNEWQDKAGAYAIQGRAACFINFISGSYSNIVGLPLYETAQLLKNKC